MTKKFPRKKFLFVTWKNDAGQLAWQIKQEGHQVKLWISYKSCIDTFDGLLDKVKNWKDHIDWADVIIFDEVGFGKEVEELKARGKKVIGGTRYTDELEWEREFGQAEMAAVGIKIPFNQEFDSFKSGIDFIRKNPSRYVFKPIGVVTQNHGLLSVSTDDKGRDLIQLFENNSRKWKNKIRRFVLQEFADGIEVGIGAFFNGTKFILPASISFEHKRLFPGNIGPLTNDMGSVMLWQNKNKFYTETIDKMTEKLREVNYVGYFDLNCIVTKDRIYPLEFTCRFGYPTIDAQLAALNMPAGEFFYRLANKEDFKLKVKPGYQVGVCAVLPPYISGDESVRSVYKDLPIVLKNGADPLSLPGVYYKDMKVEDGAVQVAGEAAYIACVTGTGKDLTKASNEAYKKITQFNVLNLFYRNDVGIPTIAKVASLKKWGYIY